MILRLRDLRWSFPERRRLFGAVRQRTVLAGVCLEVGRGEIVGLAGESGAGKTSLGLAALWLIPGATGSVAWGGDEVTGWPERRLRPLRRRFQALLQSPQAMLSPYLSVREHLEETLLRVVGLARATPADWSGVVEELGLEAVLDSRAHTLSGGEARRVGLARILLCKPGFLFADEPDAGLDPPRRVALVRRLRALASGGTGVLLVTHDRETLRRSADRVLTLREGRLEES